MSILGVLGAGGGVVAGGVAGGGDLDPLLDDTEALVQAESLLLALAVTGRVDLSKHYLKTCCDESSDLVRGDILLAVPDVRAAHAVVLSVVVALGVHLLQLHLRALLLGLGVLHGDQLQHLTRELSVNINSLSVTLPSHLFCDDGQLEVVRNVLNFTDLLHLAISLIIKVFRNVYAES